jgi:hypothetical protein
MEYVGKIFNFRESGIAEGPEIVFQGGTYELSAEHFFQPSKTRERLG